jgi:hypothetical protein
MGYSRNPIHRHTHGLRAIMESISSPTSARAPRRLWFPSALHLQYSPQAPLLCDLLPLSLLASFLDFRGKLSLGQLSLYGSPFLLCTTLPVASAPDSTKCIRSGSLQISLTKNLIHPRLVRLGALGVVSNESKAHGFCLAAISSTESEVR